MANLKQALEDVEKVIRDALEVSDKAKIRKLTISKGEYIGEISDDGETWYKFRVGETEAEIY